MSTIHPVARRPRARNQDERAFLVIGEGAERWLRRAAGEGVPRVRRKIAEAVDLSKLHGKDAVNQALDACARAGRFADGDLARILAHQQQTSGKLILLPRGEDSSLQVSTRAWKSLGR